MKCAACQSEVDPGATFCSQCGAQVVIVCSKCHHGNGPGSKFCAACGQPLARAEAPQPPIEAAVPASLSAAGERRQATMIFSDVSGFTALSERLDPEEVEDILARVKEDAARSIEKHGGTVNQFIGDEAVGLFGIPNAHEDDPVRAVKAALALHAEVRESGGGVKTRTGERLAMHTGINTGLVVAQYRNDREGLYRLTGDSVNTAARLRSTASADEILIGPNTQRLVKAYFELLPQRPILVKGKTMPFVPYRVLAESNITSRFEAARLQGFTSYVGRSRELATLKTSFGRACEGEGRFLTIEGEPGIGKSRLIDEFLGTLDREHISLPQGRCQPYATEIPYFPFLDALRRGLHLSEQDSHAMTLDNAVSAIRQFGSSLEPRLPLYLHLLAIPSKYPLPAHLQGEALRQAMEDALAELTIVITRTRPMLLVLEDWHWSDPASQSALAHLLPIIPSHRLMVIVTYRSGYGFDFGRPETQTAIHLDPLDQMETGDLMKSLTGADDLPEGLDALLHQSAGGNPLFIEEACYSLLESQSMAIRERHLVMRRPLDQVLLPDTVQAVIQARLDRLDHGVKEVVRLAAVIGRVFSQQVLERIYTGRMPVEEALETLQTQEIIRQTKILPVPEYSFRHVLTREVAYDTLLHQQRKKVHEAVGLAIEDLFADRLDEHASILAHHFARSPRADKAVHYSLLAGDRAARLYAHAEARTHYEDALAIARSVPRSPEAQRWQIDAILKQVSVGTGPREIDTDRKNLVQARTFAKRLDDRPRLAQTLYWLGRIHYVLADLHLAIAYAQESLEIAEALGDPALAAAPVNLMGRAYWQLSDFARSARMTERSVEQMRLLGNKGEEATAAGFASALFAYMGAFEKALAYSDRSITLAKELGNPYAEAASYHYRGIIRDQQGRWDQALADYATAQRIARDAGDTFRIYIARFMEGRAYHMRGDPTTARNVIEDSVSLAAKLGTTFLLGQAKTCLAACYLALGADIPAADLCEEAIRLVDKAGDRFTKALALRTLAEARWRSSATESGRKATNLMTEAVAIHETIGARPELARSCIAFACLLKAGGQTQDAQSSFERGIALFRDLDMTWDMLQAEQRFAESAAGAG